MSIQPERRLFIVVNGVAHQVVRLEGGNYGVANAGSNSNVQASVGFINRLATVFGGEVERLVTGSQYSAINVNNETGYSNTTDAAYQNVGISSTTSHVAITTADDPESFVAFALEVRVANDLVANPNPMRITSQATVNGVAGALDIQTPDNGSSTLLSHSLTRHRLEHDIRTRFNINPGERITVGGRFDLSGLNLNLGEGAPNPTSGADPPGGGTGSENGSFPVDKPLKLGPVPCLYGQPPGCVEKRK